MDYGRAVPERMVVRAEGWNHHIDRCISQRWEPPWRSWFPPGRDRMVDWTWTFLQYVFPLDDPRVFDPPRDGEWSPEERAALQRFADHARELAAAEVLTAEGGWSLTGAELDNPVVDERKSPRDATTGFMAMFRQAYAPCELASFDTTAKLLNRETHRRGGDTTTIAKWRHAQATLRHTHLDHLILVKAARDGHVPADLADRNASHPATTESPEQLLSAILYGDLIHWGDKRSVLERWDRSPIMAVKRRFDTLRSAAHLCHLYIGFAALVSLSLGDVAPDEL